MLKERPFQDSLQETETKIDLALGIGVIVATIVGPIAAVYVTRYIDEHRQTRSRRLEIFRALMASRKVSVSVERVRALNMVEIDFHGEKKVEQAFRSLMTHLNLPKPSPPGWEEDHRKLYTRLLSEMATNLGYRLQQLDVLDGGYYPQGFADIELEQQVLRRELIAIASGHRAIIVSPAAPAPLRPFPAPPPPAGG